MKPLDNWARIPATAIAAVALYEALVGIVNARVNPIPREPESWAVAYGPPWWVFGVVIALMATLALALAWKVAPTKASRLLALFAALLACGYGAVFAGDAFSGFNAVVLGFVRDMRARGMPSPLMRAVALPLLSLPNLTWVPAWLFAAATFLRFAQVFPDRTTTPEDGRRSRADRAAVLVSCWIYTASILDPGPARRTLGVLVAVASAVWVWRNRESRLLAALAAASALQAITGSGGPLASVAFISVACVGLVNGLPLLSVTHPRYVFLLPVLVSSVFLIRFDPVVELSLGLSPWLLVCFLLAIASMARRVPTLPAAGRGQVLWVFSGCSLACVLAMTFVVATLVGTAAGCRPPDTTAVCLAYRYQDWLLMLPLPILLVFLTMALLYKGHLDATMLFHRTTAYGLLALVMGFTFGAVDYELSVLLGRFFPEWFSPAAAAGSMAVAVGPIRKSVETSTDWLLKTVLRV